MSAMRGALLGCLGLAVLAAPAMGAVAIAVVPVAGSTATTVFAINDDNVVAGSFIGADGIEHAFFGMPDGNYTTFDAGDGGTEARGINDNGFVTGFSNAQSGDAGAQPIFERNPNGKIFGVKRSGEQLMGYAFGIESARNKFVGAYWDPAKHQSVAFLGQKGAWLRDVKISAVHQASAARGINSAGTIVGGYFMPPLHGFVLSDKTLATIDYPGAVATELEAINDNGKAAGQWIDGHGRTHSFVLDTATGSFADIKVKGAHQVQAWSINAAGAVAVATDIGPFVWCAKKSACPGT